MPHDLRHVAFIFAGVKNIKEEVYMFYWNPDPKGFVELLIFLAICYGIYKIDKSGGCLKIFLIGIFILFMLSICQSYDDYDKWDKERTEKLDEMARKRKREMEERQREYGAPKIVPPSELPK